MLRLRYVFHYFIMSFIQLLCGQGQGGSTALQFVEDVLYVAQCIGEDECWYK